MFLKKLRRIMNLENLESMNSEETSKMEAMENEYVLENILRFLPLPSMTKARRVCKLWYREATKHLRKLDHLVTLSTHQDFRDFKNTMDEYVKVTEDELLFTEWSLVFNEIALEDEAVQDLLNSYGAFVRKLRIRFNWRVPGNLPQTFKQLLVQQTPNLVELEFFGFPEPIWQQIHLFDENLPLLSKLKSLGCFTLIDYRHAHECPLYVNILRCLRPNQLETLKINCNNYIRIIFDEAAISPKLFDSLAGLKIFSMICPTTVATVYYGEEACQPIKELETADILTRVCSKLERLHLCLGYTGNPNTVDIICNRLANTLIELELSTHCGRRLDFVWQGNLTSLPKVEKATLLNPLYSVDSTTTLANFPNLKYWKTNCCNIWPAPVASKTYPQLSTLILEHVAQSNSHYETFTPEQIRIIGQSFPNLKTFHINRVNYQLVHAICSELRNIEELRIESDLYDVAAQIDCGITGFSPPNCYNILNKNESVVDKSEGTLRIHPFIGNLRRLQRLYVFAPISGVSFRYGFSHLKELVTLYVEIARMRVENYPLMDIKVKRSDIDKCLANMPKLSTMEIICEKPLVLTQESLTIDKIAYPSLEFIVNGRHH